MKKIKTKWYTGTTDKEGRRKQVLEHEVAWDILKQILEKELADVRDAQELKAVYDNVNWPYLQADYIARVRTLKEILDLLTIEEET